MSDSRKIEDNQSSIKYYLLTYYYLLSQLVNKIGSVLAFSKLTHFNPRQLATPLYSNIVPAGGYVFITLSDFHLESNSNAI